MASWGATTAHSPAPLASHWRRPTLAAGPNPVLAPLGMTSTGAPCSAPDAPRSASPASMRASAAGDEPLSTTVKATGTPWPANPATVAIRYSGCSRWGRTTVRMSGATL